MEPGTGLFVHFLESDGQYSLVNHPQNRPISFKEDQAPLPFATNQPPMVNEATMLVTNVSATDYLVDNNYLPIYYSIAL